MIVNTGEKSVLMFATWQLPPAGKVWLKISGEMFFLQSDWSGEAPPGIEANYNQDWNNVLMLEIKFLNVKKLLYFV